MLQLEMQLLKVEGKIIECWLVKKRVLFLNFAGEGRGGGGNITCPRLILRLPSNSLCYREVFLQLWTKLTGSMTFYSDMFSLVFDSRFSINDLKSVSHCVIDN